MAATHAGQQSEARPTCLLETVRQSVMRSAGIWACVPMPAARTPGWDTRLRGRPFLLHDCRFY